MGEKWICSGGLSIYILLSSEDLGQWLSLQFLPCVFTALGNINCGSGQCRLAHDIKFKGILQIREVSIQQEHKSQVRSQVSKHEKKTGSF